MTEPPHERTHGSSSVNGELEYHLGHDQQLIQSLRQNLRVRALFVPTTQSYPARSRIRVKIFGGDSSAFASLVAEVVFVSSQGLGLQILELDPANQKILDDILSVPGKAQAEPAPAPALPAPAVTPVVTPAVTPAPAPKPEPATHLTVPATGTLTSDLPAILLQMHHKAEGGTATDSDLPLETSLGLVQRLSKERFTGRMTVDSDEKITTQVYFRDGVIVGGHHEPEEETASVAYALRKSGRLPEADYREVQRKHAETKELEVRLLSAIVDAGALQKGWRIVIFQNVGKCLAARKSRYKLEAGAHLLSETMPLPVQLNRVLYRAIVEAAASYSNDELLAGFEPYLNLYVSKKDKLPLDVQQLRLDEKELRFLNVTLVTPTRFRTIFSVSALNRSQTLRNLYALFFLRCLSFIPTYHPPEKEFLPHLNRVWAELQGANHYNVLQVHWTALGPAIEVMYQKTKKEWEEMLRTYQNKPDYVPLLQKILGRVEEAFRFLSDDDRRRQYRDEIIEPPKRLFSAELLSQHTRTYLMRGDRKQAKAYIEMAVDIVPGNAEYRALLRECGG